MSDDPIKHIEVREWLNIEPVSSAHIITYVESRVGKYEGDNPKKVGRGYARIDSSITIADCSRNIQLDFDVHSQKEIVGRIAKIDTLIAILTDFRTAYFAAADRVRQHIETYGSVDDA